MPLFPGKSPKTFSHNVGEMMDAGHPQKQALAAAYATKRATGKKMSKGGMCAHGGPVHCNAGCYAEGGSVHSGFATNQKLHPGQEVPLPAEMAHLKSVQHEHGDDQSKVAKLAKGGMAMDYEHGHGMDQSNVKFATGGEVGELDHLHRAKGGATNMDFAKPAQPMSDYDKYAHGGETEMEAADEDDDDESMDALHMAQGGYTEDDVSQDQLEESADGGHDFSYAPGLVEEIMSDRKRRNLAKGGAVEMDSDHDSDYESRMDLEPVHYVQDNHDSGASPSKDDMGLVGQIMKERRMRKRGTVR